VVIALEYLGGKWFVATEFPPDHREGRCLEPNHLRAIVQIAKRFFLDEGSVYSEKNIKYFANPLTCFWHSLVLYTAYFVRYAPVNLPYWNWVQPIGD
jgi:hypothetical protein